MAKIHDQGLQVLQESLDQKNNCQQFQEKLLKFNFSSNLSRVSLATITGFTSTTRIIRWQRYMIKDYKYYKNR